MSEVEGAGGMEQLGRRVRVEDVEIADHERIYGRTYAGRTGRIEQFSRNPEGGDIRSYVVRLADGELITVRPHEVRFL